MDSSTSEVLSLAGAAPFITLLISVFLKPLPKVGDFITGRVTPLVALALAIAWGLILKTSGHFDGDPAVFIVTSVTVAAAASGVQSWVREYSGKNDPK